MLKTLVKCISKTTEEKLITMSPVGEITLERMDDRHQETIKDTKTFEEQASNKTI